MRNRRIKMSRVFVGTGYGEPTTYGVHVEQDGKKYSFTQRIAGAKANFQWDAAGPGSNDLARALLWVTTGVEPAWRMYRLFKSEVVSTWPRKVGECWRISSDEISQWLAGVERDTARTEDASQTEARWLQTHARDLKVKGFARMFKRKGWKMSDGLARTIS
jgi:uncharacterized protein DUF6166